MMKWNPLSPSWWVFSLLSLEVPSSEMFLYLTSWETAAKIFIELKRILERNRCNSGGEGNCSLVSRGFEHDCFKIKLAAHFCWYTLTHVECLPDWSLRQADFTHRDSTREILQVCLHLSRGNSQPSSTLWPQRSWRFSQSLKPLPWNFCHFCAWAILGSIFSG